MANSIYESMKRLINKKYYATAEEAQKKIDTFYACNRLTEEEYNELTTLINKVYN